MTYEEWKELREKARDELNDINDLVRHEFPIPKSNWRVRVHLNSYAWPETDPIDPSGNVRSWSAMPKEIVDFVLAVKDVVHKWHKGKIDDLETGLAHLKAMGEHYPGPKWGVCGCGKDLYRFSSGPRSGAVHAPEDEMHHADFYRELQEHGEIHLDE